MSDDFLGPCLHGRDPFDRCDACQWLEPHEAEALAKTYKNENERSAGLASLRASVDTLRKERDAALEAIERAHKATDHWCRWFDAIAGHQIEGWHFVKIRKGLLDLRAALETTPRQPETLTDEQAQDLSPPTHRCRICGALWRLNPPSVPKHCGPKGCKWCRQGSWTCLNSSTIGKCCDNVAMGDQIEELPRRPSTGESR